MIPAPFNYERPSSPEAALALLSATPDAAFLAGGHSLLTRLKRREERPSLVIDLSGAGLDKIQITDDGGLIVGAMVSQAKLVEAVSEADWTLLKNTGFSAGDPMIRHRGTFIGAMCEADPRGDWAASALALDASVELLMADGVRRSVTYADYLSARPSEAHLVLSTALSTQPKNTVQSYSKVKHIAVGWAVASAAIVMAPNHVRIALSGALDAPQRVRALEQAVTDMIGATPDLNAVKTAVSSAISGLNWQGDRYAPARYRAHRMAVLLEDVISDHLRLLTFS